MKGWTQERARRARPRIGSGTSLAASLATSAVIALSLSVWAVTGGDFVLAFLPVAAAVLLYAVSRAPLHWTASGILFIALATDDPNLHPANDEWQQPLHILGRALFENLNNLTGVGSLRFALVDVVIALLLLLAVFRWKDRRLSHGYIAVPRPLWTSMLLVLFAVVALEVYGMATGGNFKASLWQIRNLLWLGPASFIYFLMLRGPQDALTLGKVIFAAALWKAAIGIYYYLALCRPFNFRPDIINTHADTILYVTAIAMVMANALHRKTAGSAALALFTTPLLLIATILNSRRIAYVSLAAITVVAVALLPPGRLKRWITVTVLVISALMPIYVRLGSSFGSIIFRPAVEVSTLLAEDDSSASFRDTENYNVVTTVRGAPLFGYGFGHGYQEHVPAVFIEQHFSLYQYIPHNTMLWLWLLGGLVGFTILWMPFLVGSFFALRAHRAARSDDERTIALTCVAVIIAHEFQIYADMGTQYWMSAFLVPAALAMAGKLAVKTGAWPADS